MAVLCRALNSTIFQLSNFNLICIVLNTLIDAIHNLRPFAETSERCDVNIMTVLARKCSIASKAEVGEHQKRVHNDLGNPESPPNHLPKLVRVAIAAEKISQRSALTHPRQSL